MTVDNTNDPAVLQISSGDSDLYAQNEYDMTWYALPDSNTGHAQITKTFTWIIYTPLDDVTYATHATSYEFYIGYSGYTFNPVQEIPFPTWTTTPANLQTDGIVSETDYNLSYRENGGTTELYYVNDVEEYLAYYYCDQFTVSITNKKLEFATDDIALAD